MRFLLLLAIAPVIAIGYALTMAFVILARFVLVLTLLVGVAVVWVISLFVKGSRHVS